MTLPRRLTPGEHVTVSWDHQDGEQRFTTLRPLYEDDLIPNRPAWTPYAPGLAASDSSAHTEAKARGAAWEP